MPIPSNMTLAQSDAIENGTAIVHAAVQGAVKHLNDAGENQIAYGLHLAFYNLEQALKAIWAEPATAGKRRAE